MSIYEWTQEPSSDSELTVEKWVQYLPLEPDFDDKQKIVMLCSVKTYRKFLMMGFRVNVRHWEFVEAFGCIVSWLKSFLPVPPAEDEGENFKKESV